jgi:hypothetical protein
MERMDVAVIPAPVAGVARPCAPAYLGGARHRGWLIATADMGPFSATKQTTTNARRLLETST